MIYTEMSLFLNQHVSNYSHVSYAFRALLQILLSLYVIWQYLNPSYYNI